MDWKGGPRMNARIAAWLELPDLLAVLTWRLRQPPSRSSGVGLCFFKGKTKLPEQAHKPVAYILTE